MNVHRDVIVDLLPAYLAGEASARTRKLVEDCMADDPEFARIVAQGREDLDSLIPPTVNQKDIQTMELESVKRLALIRTLGLSVLISATTLTAMALVIGAVLLFQR